MASENTLPDSALPVKVSETDDAAPPTLAEPASGPAAAMPGVETDATAGEKPTTDVPEPTTNGSTEPPQSRDTTADAPPASDAKPAIEDPPATAADATSTEAAPQDGPETTVDDSAADVNGTPASKKASSEKRKSISVPGGKKLNKKKSIAKITHLDAKPGDHYFARLKSYPPWPAIVCDEEILPSSLRNTRPVTTKKVDGTYNEPYVDGGKKVNERTFPVMFLGTNEFAWIPNTDLSDLDPETCKDAPEKGKSKALIAAYAKAGENNDLDHYKQMIMDHTQAMEEEAAKREEARLAKKSKSNKPKRKSESKAKTAEDDDDVEMDDVDDAAEVKKSSKKRKKAADSDDDETEKPAKTPKTTKLKLTTKTPTTTEKKKEKKAPKKSEKRKSKAAGADEDDEMADAPEEEEPPKQVDPATQKKNREREVLYLRHKLQKTFLTRGTAAPPDKDMPGMSQYMKKLEDYEDLEVSIIKTTKINKVLKGIIKLNTIPRDEEFAFRKRSVDLLEKWIKILGSEPQDDSKGDEEKETAKSTPATNGVHDEASDEQQPEPAPAAEPEPESATTETKDEAKPAEPEAASATVEDKPAEAAAPVVEEEVKSEVPATALTEPVTTDKAPESAAGAAEATEAVKATE